MQSVPSKKYEGGQERHVEESLHVIQGKGHFVQVVPELMKYPVTQERQAEAVDLQVEQG